MGTGFLTFSTTLFTAGLVIESMRVMRSIQIAVKIFSAAFLTIALSIVTSFSNLFLLQYAIKLVPFSLLLTYFVLVGFSKREYYATKFNQTFTLLLSLSLIYWAIDKGVNNDFSYLVITTLVIGVFITVVAFSYLIRKVKISNQTKFVLSLFSLAMLVLFAIDNIFLVFERKINIFSLTHDLVAFGLHNVMVGASTIFIITIVAIPLNYMLNQWYHQLPSRLSNMLTLTQNNLTNRFKLQSSNIFSSILLVLAVGIIYYLNFLHEYLPIQTMIWLTIFLYQIGVEMVRIARKKKLNYL